MPFRLVAGLLIASMMLFVPNVNTEASHTGAHQSRCTVWNSRLVPPKTIRVYRVREGRVDNVSFKTYVYRVASSEWGRSQPFQLQRAGAVAVKQYAWYHILRYRGGMFRGRCFDVKDTTADQIYKVKTPPIETVRAVNSTWGIAVYRQGQFIMTGYRSGFSRRCASDVTGYKLFARSSRSCAHRGWSAEQILSRYYHAVLR